MNYDVSTGVNDIIKMSETMEKTGVAIVVVAVFLIIILVSVIVFIGVTVRRNKKREDQYESLLHETMEQNNKFVEAIINKLENTTPDQNGLFKVSVECGTLIEEHLKYLYHCTKADRVAVYVFHNGQRMLNGGHLLKCSCLNEYSLSEKYLYAFRHKDTPISQLSPICNALLDKGCYTCPDTSTVEDPQLKKWVNTYGYKSIFAKATFNTHGEVIGFVVTEFIDSPVYPDKVQITKEETRRLADKVAVAIDAELVQRGDNSDRTY